MALQWSRYWWALALRGLISVLFGLAAFIWPGVTLEVLILFIGAFMLVDGVITLVAALQGRGQHRHWWMLLLDGLVGVLAGLATLVLPNVVALFLIYLVAAWAIVSGLLEIAAAVRLRQEIEGEWRLILGGIVSIIFGVLVALWPLAGAIAFVWMIGAYAIIFGALLLALAFRLRSAGTEAPAPGAA